MSTLRSFVVATAIIFALVAVITLPHSAVAADTVSLQIQKIDLTAEAGGDRETLINKKITFDASQSTLAHADQSATYLWDFGDGTVLSGASEAHAYRKPGTYTVKLTIIQGADRAEDTMTVSVFRSFIVMLVDATPNAQELEALQNTAKGKDIFLLLLQDSTTRPRFATASTLATKILEREEDVQQAEVIIDRTSGGVGLLALSNVVQSADKTRLSFDQKGIFSVTDNQALIATIAQSTFNAIRPKFLVTLAPAQLSLLVTTPKAADALQTLRNSGGDFHLITTTSGRMLSPVTAFNFLAHTVSKLINSGTSVETIILILCIPIVATFFTLMRQLVGLRSFGIFIPTILALTFASTGLKYGVVLLIGIIVASSIARFILKRFRILFIPRMAIILTFVTVGVFGVFYAANWTNHIGILATSVFPILLLITVGEKFIEVQTEEGVNSSIRLTIETILLATLAYFLITWGDYRSFLITYPEVILLTIPLNLVLGRWTKLTLLEYIRFQYALRQ